jgi:protein-S-isoprenylcysteine O-methyltransferase Ste14
MMPQLIIYTWPYALLFWLVFLWAFVPEWRIAFKRRQASTPTTSQDANSKNLIIFGQSAAMFAAFFVASAVPSATFAHPVPWFWAGLATIVAGSLLRRHCWRMLGRRFTGDVIVNADQEVVDRGAYRYIRHPSYTAAAILFFGIGLALTNWISVVVLIVTVAIVYGYRVHVEERTLVAVIGDPYRRYMLRTKRFVPFLF